ncbi:hypothetical protein HYW20_03495 [Candidatus Woesearchaeota archaeon]|nr:hypothetical protein [Candidatus Woesearchaeota archaeon]
MVVVVSQKHLSLNKRLAKEINRAAVKFDNSTYSKIKNIDAMLLKRDVSPEKKKAMLIKCLHDSIVTAFSIDKKKFNAKTFESLKKRLHNIRRIIIRLRSINYYMETALLKETEFSKIKTRNDAWLRRYNEIATDELEALEYTAYKLIEEAVTLDKRLLTEYAIKGGAFLRKEKAEAKDIMSVLAKESGILEHLESKLPPPKAASPGLMKELVFTHWVVRVFALLSYLEHLYAKETAILSQLKKNKAIKTKINEKIAHIIKEKSKLLEIMGEKAASMEKFRINDKSRKEIHNLTSIITV